VLKDSENRTALFNEIIENPDFMEEFMEHLQENDNVMRMMQGNKRMKGHMM